VEDSNVAGLGGKENKDLVKSVAVTEPAWKRHADYANGKILETAEAVKDAKGYKHHVEIWRIEKFKVQFWPREKIGEFFSGDSYIILHTTNEERDMTGLPASAKKAAGESKIQFDLHFWLGKDTTQDEAGTAAYKTVELDTLLDDVPVQHREVQGYESTLFLRIFSELYKCGGLRYMEGGVDSGFKHVEPEKYTPRLMHLKGRKKVRINQVEMKMSSLNSGDLFILDQGLTITVWTGTGAGMFEKNKGRETADAMRQARAGKAVVKNVREDDDGGNDDLINFYKALGGKPGDRIKSAAEGGNDDEEEKVDTSTTQLWRLSDASGSLKFTREKVGGVRLTDFDANDVFVYDAGFQIFVWVGKGATKQEKDNAIPNAVKYLADNKRPNHLQITRELHGAETNAFHLALSK
jgi:hypothetical protein